MIKHWKYWETLRNIEKHWETLSNIETLKTLSSFQYIESQTLNSIQCQCGKLKHWKVLNVDVNVNFFNISMWNSMFDVVLQTLSVLPIEFYVPWVKHNLLFLMFSPQKWSSKVWKIYFLWKKLFLIKKIKKYFLRPKKVH
jgi:hypothetical protein